VRTTALRFGDDVVDGASGVATPTIDSATVVCGEREEGMKGGPIASSSNEGLEICEPEEMRE
jgi:hypothetical protein